MRPLGHIESYESFSQEFLKVLSEERAIGFLLDCPKTFSLEKSRLVDAPRSIIAMNELMVSQMSIYYLSPRNLAGSKLKSTKEYRDLAARFNEQIISGLRLPFQVNYPCLILFKPTGDTLGDRIYIELGKDQCFYFGDIYQAVSNYLNVNEDRNGQVSRIREILTRGYQSAKDELPKTVFLKSLEFSFGGLVALGASFIGT